LHPSAKAGSSGLREADPGSVEGRRSGGWGHGAQRIVAVAK
jgi:hypothetical protein